MHAQAAVAAGARGASFDTVGEQYERARVGGGASPASAVQPGASGAPAPATSTTPPGDGYDPAKIERPANNGGVYDSDADFRTFM